MSNEPILLRCKSCRTVNRVPAEKIGNHPVCGNCGVPLEFPYAPVHGTSFNFSEEVLDCPGAVLIEFWAKWCGACRIIAPVLDQVASEMAGRLKVVKIDVDEQPFISAQFHIKATPTLVLYNNGKKINELAGTLNRKQMEEWIAASLNA